MTPAESILEQALEAMSREDSEAALQILDRGIAADPAEARFHLVRGVAEQQAGRPDAGFACFWRALELDPHGEGARLALAEAAVSPGPGTAAGRDFSLLSGERQVAPRLSGIRADHRARYAAAAAWLRDHLEKAHLRTGLDLFCGNGYGSRMVADLAGPRMVGIDGSAEAALFATVYYGSPRVVFGRAVFPFSLRPGLFDFAVCFESIEHIADPAELLRQMAIATGNGPIALSSPLDSGMPFAANRQRFIHHIRHFTEAEIRELLAAAGWTKIAVRLGQTVYHREGELIGEPLAPERMELGPVDADTQFLFLIATA